MASSGNRGLCHSFVHCRIPPWLHPWPVQDICLGTLISFWASNLVGNKWPHLIPPWDFYKELYLPPWEPLNIQILLWEQEPVLLMLPHILFSSQLIYRLTTLSSASYSLHRGTVWVLALHMGVSIGETGGFFCLSGKRIMMFRPLMIGSSTGGYITGSLSNRLPFNEPCPRFPLNSFLNIPFSFY